MGITNVATCAAGGAAAALENNAYHMLLIAHMSMRKGCREHWRK